MFLKKSIFKKTLFNIALSVLACSPFSVMASNAYEENSGWNWSVDLGSVNIDSKVAYDQYIGSSATLFGFAGERYSDASDFTLTLGIDFVSYDDQGDFYQNTTGGYKTSSASGMLLFAEYGPKIRFGLDNENYFIAHGGLSQIIASDRSISYCSDCYSESINVDGGLYGILGVGHSFNSFDVDVQYQQYFTGDLDNSLRVKFSFSF